MSTDNPNNSVADRGGEGPKQAGRDPQAPDALAQRLDYLFRRCQADPTPHPLQTLLKQYREQKT